MQKEHFEIERKFLICFPDMAYLQANGQESHITQTYLLRPAEGKNARLRAREAAGKLVYTHTVKTRINDLRRIEDEREICEEEYRELLRLADPERRTIHKTRWVLPYEGQILEIDMFPFWDDRAILEIELEDESQPVKIPPELKIIREVTADRRYTNAAMSREIPMETLKEGKA